MTEEAQLKLMRALEADPYLSQRALAAQLGMSLGKVNYCLRALIARGLVKTPRFTPCLRPAAKGYLLTREGRAEKARVTRRFLVHKLAEFEAVKGELEQLRHEAGESGPDDEPAG